MNSIFKQIKSQITARQAAERYGISVKRNGMACCIFHDDYHPSMKLDERYYCFSCHATGDVINFVAQLYGLSSLDAAKKLASDFNIDISDCIHTEKTQKNEKKSSVFFKHDTEALSAKLAEIQKRAEKQNILTWVEYAQRILIRYRLLLIEWKECFAPKEDSEQWHPLFVEACQQEARVEYLLDLTYQTDEYEYAEFYQDFSKEVKQIEQRMEQYNKC